MAIAFRTGSGAGSTSEYSNSANSLTLALSSSIVTGDYVMVAVGNSSSTEAAPSMTLTGGGVTWNAITPIGNGGSAGFGTYISVQVFAAYAVAGTAGSTLTFGVPLAAEGEMQMASAAWSGVTGIETVPAASVATASTGPTTLAQPSATTTAATDWLVSVIGLWTTAAPALTMTNPANSSNLEFANNNYYQYLGFSDSNGTVAQGAVGGGSWSWASNPTSDASYADGAGFLIALQGAAPVTAAPYFPPPVLSGPGRTGPSAFQYLVPPPPPQTAFPPISSLVDPLTSFNTTLWTRINAAYDTYSASSGLTISSVANSTTYAGIQSNGTYSLVNSSASIAVTNAGNQSLASFQAVGLYFKLNTTNSIQYIINNGSLKAQTVVSGTTTTVASLTYNAATMAYLRVRETGGRVYYDYSGDEVTWTNFTSLADPIPLTALTLIIQAGTYNSETSATSATFRGLNEPPLVYTFVNNAATSPGMTWASPVLNAMSVGDYGVLFVNNNTSTLTGISDSKNNTWTLADTQATAPDLLCYVSTITTALTLTDTITATFSGSPGGASIVGRGLMGGGSLDQNVAAVTGTSTTPSISTGTLESANEWVIGAITDTATGGVPTITGWSSVITKQPGSTQHLTVADQFVSSSAAVTLSGTITSAAWTAELLSVVIGASVTTFTAATAASTITAYPCVPSVSFTGATASEQIDTPAPSETAAYPVSVATLAIQAYPCVPTVTYTDVGSSLTIAAPIGTGAVTGSGASSATAVTAPAGSASVIFTGASASVTVTAYLGTASVTLPGAVAASSVSASLGSATVSVPESAAGVAIQAYAPTGSVATGLPAAAETLAALLPAATVSWTAPAASVAVTALLGGVSASFTGQAAVSAIAALTPIAKVSAPASTAAVSETAYSPIPAIVWTAPVAAVIVAAPLGVANAASPPQAVAAVAIAAIYGTPTVNTSVVFNAPTAGVTVTAYPGTATVSYPAQTATVTVAAPVPSATVAYAALRASLTVAAPIPASHVFYTASVAAVAVQAYPGAEDADFTAPAASEYIAAFPGSGTVTYTGQTAALSTQAYIGTASVIVPCQVASVTVTAPQPSGSVLVTGVTAQISITAPAGIATARGGIVRFTGAVAGITITAIPGVATTVNQPVPVQVSVGFVDATGKAIPFRMVVNGDWFQNEMIINAMSGDVLDISIYIDPVFAQRFIITAPQTDSSLTELITLE